MLAPVQTKNTARMGNAPVNNAPVNEPKNLAVPGQEGREQGAAQQWHDHHAAGHALDRPLDGNLRHLAIPLGRA